MRPFDTPSCVRGSFRIDMLSSLPLLDHAPLLHAGELSSPHARSMRLLYSSCIHHYHHHCRRYRRRRHARVNPGDQRIVVSVRSTVDGICVEASVFCFIILDHPVADMLNQ